MDADAKTSEGTTAFAWACWQGHLAGRLLRTSTRPTLNLILLLRPPPLVCVGIHTVGQLAPISVEYMFSMTLLLGDYALARGNRGVLIWGH